MAILKILQYPNVRLKKQALAVTEFDARIRKIIDDMFETHYAATNCAALAATQLDINHPPHITVIDFSEKKNQPLCLVNANIIAKEGKCSEEEGCMSIGCNEDIRIFAKVTRANKVKIKALDRYGNPLEFEADGFMAKCVQHELDHLNGIIYLDHLSSLRRQRLEKHLKKSRHWKRKKKF